MARVLLRVEALDPRVVPAVFEWSPQPGNGWNWNTPGNWKWQNPVDPAQWFQNTNDGTAPGADDEARFVGVTDNCRVAQPVTIKRVLIDPSYTKSLVLSSPLTVDNKLKDVGGLFRFESPFALIVGSLPDPREPAHQGSLIIAGGSTFSWRDGTLENVDVTLGHTASGGQQFPATGRVLGGGSGLHAMINSSITVQGVLDWEGGNVVAGGDPSAATVWVAEGGTFNMMAAGGTWGSAPDSFVLHNAGRVVGQASVRIAGDYLTSGTTTVEREMVEITGQAVQSAGAFHLANRATVVTKDLDIVAGSLSGDGTVVGNLALGSTSAYSPIALMFPGRLQVSTGGGGVSVAYIPGTIDVSGDFLMLGGNSYIDIESSSAGHGKIVIAGEAQLAGTFSFTRHPDFKPTAGFDVVTFGSNPSRSWFSQVHITTKDWWEPGWVRWIYLAPTIDSVSFVAVFRQPNP